MPDRPADVGLMVFAAKPAGHLFQLFAGRPGRAAKLGLKYAFFLKAEAAVRFQNLSDPVYILVVSELL